MSYSFLGSVAILINLIMNRKILKTPRHSLSENSAEKEYRNFILGVLTFLATDVAWGILEENGLSLLLYIDTVIYYVAMYFAVLLWTRYVVKYSDDKSSFAKALLIVGNVLFSAELVALFANHFYHFFFWIDSSGEYHAYAFRYIALVIQGALFIVTAIYSFVMSRKMANTYTARRYRAIGAMGLAMCGAIAIQMLYPLMPYYALGYMICTCMINAYVIEDEKDELRRKADGASKAKTEFLFNMSHDIRTPMNAITGFTEKALKNKNNPEVLEQSLMKVKTSSEYLLKIINDILDMAKIESGKLELQEEINYVEDGNKTVLEIFGGEAARKDITFETYFEIKDKYLWFDGNRMLQIIANLLSNSVKYTNPGGIIHYSIVQKECETEGYADFEIIVEDNGIGMSSEFQKKVFDSFEREQSATQSGAQGTGLGMSIVKKLSDAFGNTISVESKQGEGTKITMLTRCRIATPKEIELFEETRNNAITDVVNNLIGKRVLLAEDNELNREIASDILADEGIFADTVKNGSEAIAILKEKGPNYYDCILMDIQMPVMNGYEATKAIRQMYPNNHIPIIALSANAFEEDKNASFSAGMDGHVAKPINAKELFTIMKKFC